MIIAFRNYFRNKMVNLTAQSVRHFVPNCEVHCFTFYKENEKEYDDQEPLLDYVTNHFYKTNIVTNKSQYHDHADKTKTSGFENPKNGEFFSESFNLIQNYFKDVDDTVLCLCEDHFFTTGKTLKEITSEDYHIAYGNTDQGPNTANGCILAFNPSKVSHFFPINPTGTVEKTLGDGLIAPAIKAGLKVYELKNRQWVDYCGDGLYTNSSAVIKKEMVKAGIL